MIPKSIPMGHTFAVVATNPSSREMYGAPYQTLLWASLHGDDFSSDGDNREVG
jgi:hypothetical protein